MLVNESLDKISKVDDHIGIIFKFIIFYKYIYDIHLATTFAGLIADSRTLVSHSRTEAQNYWFTYNRKIRVQDVTQSVANLALHFGDDDSKVYFLKNFFLQGVLIE